MPFWLKDSLRKEADFHKQVTAVYFIKKSLRFEDSLNIFSSGYGHFNSSLLFLLSISAILNEGSISTETISVNLRLDEI